MAPRFRSYANGWYTVERTPADFHAAARRAVARGYRALKLDPFGAGFYEMEPPVATGERLHSLYDCRELLERQAADNVIRAHPRQEVHFNLFAKDWHKRKPEP